MTSNEQSVLSLIEHGVLKTPAVIAAFKSADRARFVSEQYQTSAYEDKPLPIGCGQTISQPTTVAIMLELLQVKPGQKILDIGSGSGWTTALLSNLVGKRGRVVGLERIPELVELGSVNLAKMKTPWAQIQHAGTALGLASEVPFDRILVSASAERMPSELIEQLTENGKMVLPVGESLFRVEKSPRGIAAQEIPGFVFVPLVE